MYLSMLAQSEKLAFYSLAHTLASVHKGVSEAEQEILNAALQEMGISKPSEILDTSAAFAALTSESSKKIAILELMLIALIDENFADEEESFIEQLVKNLALSENQIERAATWAEATLAQHRKGLRFITG